MKTRAATSDGFLCRGLGESLKPSVRWGRGDVGTWGRGVASFHEERDEGADKPGRLSKEKLRGGGRLFQCGSGLEPVPPDVTAPAVDPTTGCHSARLE